MAEEEQNPNLDENGEPLPDPDEELKAVKAKIQSGLSRIDKTADNRSFAFTNLNVEEKEIANLFEILVDYPHLRYLNISNNTIKDIPNVVNITHLLQLNASKNQINDISFFANDNTLMHLQFVNLSTNQLTSLPKLNLPMLRKLNLNENLITSCEEFTGHNNLEILEIRKNKLTNLKGIGNMSKLQELYADENEIVNFSDLVNLPELNVLHLRQNSIINLSFTMPQLPKLNHLNIRANKIEKMDEFAQLKQIPSLRSLNSKENPTTDEAGDGSKKEIIKIFQQITRCQKEPVTQEDRLEAFQEIQEKKAADEEARKAEEEARLAEEEAKRAEEEAAKENQEEAAE